MKTVRLSRALGAESYPGRGIVVGLTADGKNAAVVYFIMGRSSNSRNRIFSETKDGIIIYPFDATKVEDPSLIIYSPVREAKGRVVVTNGNQTDTIVEFLGSGKTFEEALETRAFEPDSPNYTPRISAELKFDGGYSYKESILKCSDGEGGGCNRFTFSYSPVRGVGHFIHTYASDGNPIPSFFGEPEAVEIGSDFDEFASDAWNALDENNKVALYAAFIDLASGKKQTRIYNKNQK